MEAMVRYGCGTAMEAMVSYGCGTAMEAMVGYGCLKIHYQIDG